MFVFVNLVSVNFVCKFGKLLVGHEGVALYRDVAFVDCVYQENLVGQLELE